MSYTPTEWESTDVVTATRMNALETAVGDMNMSYTPNVWSDGDILSADKMNALEQAVASGGGGSSDFSTAQVTIVTGANGIALSGGVESMSEGYIFIKSAEYGDIGVTTLGVPSQSTATAKALLFKNLDLEEIPHEFTAFFTAVDGTIATVDGNCEIVEETSILIWGDCTITVS